MSTYDIRKVFSYNIATSSLEYIRNYNFNSLTVTDIPVSMFNSGSTIPITVNITTTEPWMQIVDPTTGLSKKYPQGNIVLPPTSSAVVLLKIDLPPDIESIPSSSIYPEINLEIKSGSMPIIPPSTSGSNSGSNSASIASSVDLIVIAISQTFEVSVTLYDVNGNIDMSSEISWNIEDTQVAQVVEQLQITDYRTRNIFGVAAGDTNLVITAGELTKKIPITVKNITPGGGGGASEI